MDIDLESTSPQLEKINAKDASSMQEDKFDLQLSVADTGTSQPRTIVPVKVDHEWDKKIIKTATVKLEVKEFRKYDDYLHGVIKKHGGYVAREEQNHTGEKSETVISIKVPVSQFADLVNELALDDSKIIQREIATNDVTTEFVDIKSRLEAKKQMRLKYLEFMRQAKNMQEVLQVQADINRIQEEIESVSGRIQFLSGSSALSTINLTYFQPVIGADPANETPSFFTRIANAFKIGGSWMADILVGLMSIWPVLLIIFLIILTIRKGKYFKPVHQTAAKHNKLI
jgi:hypothetical protein